MESVPNMSSHPSRLAPPSAAGGMCARCVFPVETSNRVGHEGYGVSFGDAALLRRLGWVLFWARSRVTPFACADQRVQLFSAPSSRRSPNTFGDFGSLLMPDVDPARPVLVLDASAAGTGRWGGSIGGLRAHLKVKESPFPPATTLGLVQRSRQVCHVRVGDCAQKQQWLWERGRK